MLIKDGILHIVCAVANPALPAQKGWAVFREMLFLTKHKGRGWELILSGRLVHGYKDTLLNVQVHHAIAHVC